MKSDLPPVRQRALEAAREAARRRGVTAGEWLDAAILASALQQGVEPQRSARPRDPGHEDADRPTRSTCRLGPTGNRAHGDLAAIGLLLQQALPRRAIEALECEVRRLADRIDSARLGGADAATLARVERGVADMRDALRSLIPEENLFGVARALQQLSDRIDRCGGGAQDPAALRRIEGALVAMRGIATRVASSDALAKLSDEVRGLAGQIEQATSRVGGSVLSALESRLAGLAAALETRNRSGGNCAPELGGLVKALIDKIERGQAARDGHSSLARLEELIAKLADKLDACVSRLDRLEAIEQGFARLQVEYQRVSNLARAPGLPAMPEIDDLSRDVACLRPVEKQTPDSRTEVRGTLGRALDRPATTATDTRGNCAQDDAWAVPSAASVLPPGGPIPPPPVASADPAALVPEGAAAARPASQPGAQAADRDVPEPRLPPDHPSKSGLGAGRGRNPGSPADRVLNSEATPGAAKPEVDADCGGKSDFIAAARRAVQAAGEQDLRQDRASPARRMVSASAGPAHRIGKLSALIGIATAVLTLLGGLQIARTLRSSTDAAKVSALGQAAGEVGRTPPAPAAATIGPTAAHVPAPGRGRSAGVRGTDGTTVSAPAVVAPDAMPAPPALGTLATPPGVR